MEHFPKNTVFRVGGDEFLILCENWSQMEFEHAVNCLKNDMIEGVSFMAVGSVWLPCCDENVENTFQMRTAGCMKIKEPTTSPRVTTAESA